MQWLLAKFVKLVSGPAEICRLDGRIIKLATVPKQTPLLIRELVWTIALTSGIYGAVFGIWRSPEQALYSALKMPVLMFSVTFVSALINSMLAKVVGSGLSARQTFTSILLGFAVTSILLASLAPVMLFIVTQIPASGDNGATAVYGPLLAWHTAVIGVCGILGNMRLYRFVCQLSNSIQGAKRTLVSWIVVSGFVGCQLSWLISPFLARPDLPIPFWNPNAFQGNFFEYLWAHGF